MKVVSYYNVLPVKNKSEEKVNILKKFIQGVNAAGDTGLLYQGYELQSCDVGMIQGWQHETGKDLPHLRLRQSVINCTANTHVCTADSNLFLYASKTNAPHHYLRYSFDGVFPKTGIYFDDVVDPNRWKQISKDLGITLEKTKKNGTNILICAQRDGGWSMGKINLVEWLLNVCKQIQMHSDRPIVIRLHPNDNKNNSHQAQLQKLIMQFRNVSLSPTGIKLEEDLKDCFAVVNHNSSSIVGPIIMGYPAFITDFDKSQCSEVSHHSFENIETPTEFNREMWLERISMFHWKFSEIEEGTAWKLMRNYVRQ